MTTAITREYLDALTERATRALNNPRGQQYDAAVLLASDLPAAIAALHRVLDLCDESDGRDGGELHSSLVRAALAGTQTERCINCSSPTCDGEACAESPYQPRAGTQTDGNVIALPCPTCQGRSRETVGMVCQTCGRDYGAGTQTESLPEPVGTGNPAPSSPERIEAVSQAFLAADWTTRYRRDLAAVAVAALDAYDREHPKPDLRGKVVGAAQIEADLRERIAAEIEANEPALFGSPEDPYQRGWSQSRGQAARIARGGQS